MGEKFFAPTVRRPAPTVGELVGRVPTRHFICLYLPAEVKRAVVQTEAEMALNKIVPALVERRFRNKSVPFR